MDPIMVARLWMLIKPVRLLRNRRRAKKGLPPLTDSEVAMPHTIKIPMPDGTTIERTEPLIQARTSTKLGGGGLATMGLSALALIPYYNEANELIKQACTAENGPLIFLGGMGVMLAQSWYTARKTKSPLSPKVL